MIRSSGLGGLPIMVAQPPAFHTANIVANVG
jgi:hypothetical protein